MASRTAPVIIPFFTWTHFATEGKLDNITDAIGETDANQVLLGLLDPTIDPALLDQEELIDRLARCKKVIASLKRSDGLTAALALPGLLNHAALGAVGKKQFKLMLELACQTKAKTLWLNDTGSQKKLRRTKGNDPKQLLLTLARTAQRVVSKQRSKIRLGLLAGLPEYYGQDISIQTLAKTLAGDDPALLAIGQGSASDQCRTGILDSALQILSLPATDETVEYVGLIDVSGGSSFHKSAEASQVQINLNLLWGRRQILFDGFDESGTAPDSENPFLKMMDDRERFTKKLIALLGESAVNRGIGLIGSDETSESTRLWCKLLWRMSMPVRWVSANTPASKFIPGVHVLVGDSPAKMKRGTLEKLFELGVLLDAQAAQTIQTMGHGDLLGATVGGRIKNVDFEILSDQGFAAPYYGYRSVMASHFVDEDFHALEPNAPGARTLTTLAKKNKLPNTPGMVFYDMAKKNRRSAILPYTLNKNNVSVLMTTQRQRHFHDLLGALGARPLTCFAESAPDLVPFYLEHEEGKRVVLALLNTSFDWAIDTRIRLGALPKKIKRVRELDDNGKLNGYNDLKIQKSGTYQYLTLCPDTAIPPMQMGVFVLD